MKPLDEVAQDFDRIANAQRSLPASDALTPSEASLLKHIPVHARRAIDVGCGDGRFARALARRGLQVTAIDISPAMLELARERTDAGLAIDFREGNVMSEQGPAGTYDAVTSISMVHHLPLSDVVPRLARLVAPGGTLLIQDVTQRDGLRYLLTNFVAAARAHLRRLLRGQFQSREIARLYNEHGKGEKYLSASEVAHVYRELLPGARVINQIEWRYTVVWIASA